MGHTILYIEDDSDNSSLMKRLLERRGYHLLQAATGLEGLAIAQREEVDLILLDINLPDIDGYEVARRLRSDEGSKLARTPIIIITANVLKSDYEKAMRSGFEVYVAKPYDIDELWRQVETFVPAPKRPARDETIGPVQQD
jgi:two-component system cell cycle response regulator DivK